MDKMTSPPPPSLRKDAAAQPFAVRRGGDGVRSWGSSTIASMDLEVRNSPVYYQSNSPPSSHHHLRFFFSFTIFIIIWYSADKSLMLIISPIYLGTPVRRRELHAVQVALPSHAGDVGHNPALFV
jgi:hypothetical protein